MEIRTLALILVCASCAASASSAQQMISPRSVILPLSQAKILLLPRLNKGIKSYWTPTPDQIRELEKHWSQVPRLKPNYWTDTQEELKAVRSAMPEYYRQYVGFTRNNQKIILVNAFRRLPPRSVDRDWHTQAIIVFDGGPGFFTVEYSVSRHKFAHLLWFLNP